MLQEIPGFDKVEKVRCSLLDTKLGSSKCDIHVKDDVDKGHSYHFFGWKPIWIIYLHALTKSLNQNHLLELTITNANVSGRDWNIKVIECLTLTHHSLPMSDNWNAQKMKIIKKLYNCSFFYSVILG